MGTTKQCSSQQGFYIIMKRGPVQGELAEGRREPLSFLRPCLLVLAAASPLALGLLVPLRLPCNLVSLSHVAFVSLHLFRSLASLCWLFGSWPNSFWGLYRNC